MYKNVIDPGKSVYFVLKDIDTGGQNQYAMCTGPLYDDQVHDAFLCGLTLKIWYNL